MRGTSLRARLVFLASALFGLGLAAHALAPSVSEVRAQAQDELEVIPVQGNVFMLQTAQAGGNVGVLPGPDGVLLVDDQVPGQAPGVVRAVGRITDEPVRYVVNTHIHIDHIGGNELLAGMGATIVAHENVYDRMLTELRIPRGGGTFMPQPAESARPTLTFADTMTFRMNGEEVRVFRVPPAHTDGDVFVHFTGSDVLHTGDVFRTNMYPIVDVYNGGSVAGMLEAMDIAVDLAGPETKVIPGHGFGVSDRVGLIEVRDMLADLRDRVTTLIAEGNDLEQVLAARPSADYDEQWGQVPSWNEADLLPIIYYEAGGGSPR